MSWSNGLAEWTDEKTAYLSVVFSWRLSDAYQRAIFYRSMGYQVRAGGPAVWANRKYLADVAELGGAVDALSRHNPLATIASRGCSVGCWFCVVPTMEGREFTLLWDFEPRPILCDNNLSALPVNFQEHIIKRYQESGVILRDANSGFEPRTFDKNTYERWRQILKGPWRFAYDDMQETEDVKRMMSILKNEPPSRKRVYVLIGNETKADCLARVKRVIDWGGEPHCQPIMALNTLVKKPMVRHDWTERELTNMARWANRFIWRKVAYEDYKHNYITPDPATQEALL